MSDVLVVGAGFGGIAAALRMRAKGYSVTVIDRGDQLGGRAQVFERNGFVFDAGPTVITAPFLFDELFGLFGKRTSDYVKIVPVEPWYRFYYDDGSVFNYGGTTEDTLKEIAKISPGDVDGYKRLLRTSEAIFNVGFTQLADKPFHNLFSMLKQIPNLIRLGSYRTVWQLIAAHLKHEKLRQAFSIQPLLVGGNPFATTSIYNLIHFLERKWGIHFAIGGTGAVVDGLERLMKEQGIEIRLNETVKQLITQNNKVVGVELESGEQISCTMAISNADPTHLYGKMLSRKSQRLSAKLKTQHSSFSMGLFVLYFGTRRTFSDVAHHTIWLGKRYKELLSDIFDNKILANDFSLYVHRPTATDPDMAPEGCDSFYVLSPVPNLQADIDWSTEGGKYAEKIIDALDKTMMPGVRTAIVEQFHMTPADFEKDYCSTHGAGFSIAPTLMQSAWFRFHNKSEGPENLYLVGAGTHPGAGVPGVLSSAKVLEHLIPDNRSLEEANGSQPEVDVDAEDRSELCRDDRAA
jgi:phytoene desaturase